MTATRNVVCVYNRPSGSSRDWFQDPLWIQKPKDAQVPWSALPIFGSAYADSPNCGSCSTICIYWKKTCVEVNLCSCSRVDCAGVHTWYPLLTQTQTSSTYFSPVPFFIHLLMYWKFTSIYRSAWFLLSVQYSMAQCNITDNSYGINVFIHNAVISNHAVFFWARVQIYLLVNFQIQKLNQKGDNSWNSTKGLFAHTCPNFLLQWSTITMDTTLWGPKNGVISKHKQAPQLSATEYLKSEQYQM